MSSRIGRVARTAVLAGLRGWSEGAVTIAFLDGESIRIGAAEAREHATVRVHDDAFFLRILLRGEMGAGESYVAGEWDSDDVVTVIRLFLRNLPRLGFETGVTRLGRISSRWQHRLRDNRRGQSERNIRAHYDLGNDFYALMLDPSMAYSCAYFASPTQSLEAAQTAKFERVCEKLSLGPRDHVLEIGCGWGGFAVYASRTRGCRVTGITVSRAQHDLARERVRAAGLGERVDILFRDYREVHGRFDKIVSIEMLEAVGHPHLASFFARCEDVLDPRGMALVQTISMPDHRYEAYRHDVDWTQKYIFPGVHIPSLSAITAAMAARSRLTVRHLEDIGPHYAPTLRAWRERFVANLERVRALGFDATFERTWTMYLCFSEAAFAERQLGDLQIVFAGAENRAV
jgi:cyclopropane-fatty-acyl-phospholipid synthase